MMTPAGDAKAKLTGRPLPLLPGVLGTATFSEDSRHRYDLWRIKRPGAPFALFIGLNPSIGAPEIDDPTLRRIQAFATREGFDNVCIANAFSIRGTDPGILRRVFDAVGSDNNRTLVDLHERSALTVAAWGDDGKLFMRDHNLRRLLAPKALVCLGYTASGYPRHPLYVKGDAPLTPYPRPLGGSA